jgi:hypothetical protein
MVWRLPEEERVRQSVCEAIGRKLRDVYKQHEGQPLPAHMIASLARLDGSQGGIVAYPSDHDDGHMLG